MPLADSGRYEIKHVRVNATADGNNTVISAVTGKKIRILSYVITATAAGTVSFTDGTNTYAAFSLAANGGVSYAGGSAPGAAPAFEVAVSSNFVINTQTSQDVLGHITYSEVR